jgi:hypothetical protein
MDVRTPMHPDHDVERRLPGVLRAIAPKAPPDLAERIVRQAATTAQRTPRTWWSFALPAMGAATAAAVVAVLAVGVATLQPRPTAPAGVAPPTIDASPSPATSPEPATSPDPTSSPGLTPGPVPTASAPPVTTDLELDIQTVPGADPNTPMRNLGDEIVWADGPNGLPTDVYRYVPGASEPEILYTNPERPVPSGDGFRVRWIEDIAGSSAGYVIGESDVLFEDSSAGFADVFGARVWYIPAPGAEPVLLARFDQDLNTSPPQVTMDERYIVWTEERPATQTDDGLQEFRMVEIGALDESVTVLSRTAADPIRDFDLVSGELWYSECEPCRIEMIDVADLDAPVQAIPAVTDGRFAVTDDLIIWPDASDRDCLTIHDRATQSTTSTGACDVLGPSVGDRFLAWTPAAEGDGFVVYDLEDGTLRRIGDYRFWEGDEVSDPSLRGDLLVFLYWPAGMGTDAPTELRWAWMPSPGAP